MKFRFILPVVLCYLSLSCGSAPSIGNAQLEDECPYQRFKFIGSSTVSSEKGIKLLNNLEAALELEKSYLTKTGSVNNNLKVEVANYFKETGNFEIPVDRENATAYTKMANSICTLRKDFVYGNNPNITQAQRERATDQYIEMLSLVDGIKKKLLDQR